MTGRFYVKSFGCKVNQCDGDELARRIEELGLERTAEPREAALCVVNGCTVTATADTKCMKLVRSLRRVNPSARIVLTGCTAVRLTSDIDLKTGDYELVAAGDMAGWQRIVSELHDSADDETGAVTRPPTDRTRAFIKVQDGCDAFCSYCIVPHVRGIPRSESRARIFADIERAMDRGVKEIVLTGTRLGKYGLDLDNQSSLSELIEDISDRFAVPRIRLSSIDLSAVTDDLIATFGRVRSIQHHVHLPLQSGDRETLHAMNRSYDPAEFADIVERIRDLWPDAGITTDVMVGFPGETDSAFDNTMAFVEKTSFSRLHVFRYSPRPGTPASAMANRVADGKSRSRSRALSDLGIRMAHEFALSHIGRDVEVLVESRRHRKTGWTMGFTGNYLEAVIRDGIDDMINKVVTARVGDVDGTTLVCDAELADE